MTDLWHPEEIKGWQMYWQKGFYGYSLEDAREQAEKKLATAKQIAEHAANVYRADNSRTNLIGVQAAARLVKESKAQLAEWSND